jgi:exodeoxyribonuclease VII large subunit
MVNVYSIEGITAYIRELLESDPPLQDIRVRGEISNLTVASSGHWYFTLKETNAQLKCVMWRSDAARQTSRPREGDAVEVHGRLTVYPQRGEYQLVTDAIHAVGGSGDLYAQFEALKLKLAAEGLFEEDRKRPLPLFPHRIGVVTSPDAAAFRDIQNVLARRFPLAEIILSPTLVQGSEAPVMIVQALERLNRYQAADVILIIRGGGSIEDLWAFNDERVARAVADSAIVTISGVGHETDFTIVDFVADMRAPTPSAAAEIATPDLRELRQDIERARIEFDALMQAQIETHRANLESIQRNLRHLSPRRRLEDLRQRLDERVAQMDANQSRSIRLLRERLAARTLALDAANPLALLARGYAIVTRSDDGTIVRQPADAPVGSGLTIQLAQGELKARVEDQETHGKYKRTLF